MELRFRYKKSQVMLPLFVGIGSVICGCGSVFFGTDKFSLSGIAGLGILWLIIGLLRRKSGYLKITDTEIIRHDVIPTRVKISDITEIKKFAGDWLVKYKKDKELILTPEAIQSDQKAELDQYLSDLRITLQTATATN